MKFDDFIIGVYRLAILRVLKIMPGREANCRVIHRGLKARGHNISLDVVKTQVTWLGEQTAVETTSFDDGSGDYLIAKLTQRGADYLDGTTSIPGIADPFEA